MDTLSSHSAGPTDLAEAEPLALAPLVVGLLASLFLLYRGLGGGGASPWQPLMLVFGLAALPSTLVLFLARRNELEDDQVPTWRQIRGSAEQTRPAVMELARELRHERQRDLARRAGKRLRVTGRVAIYCFLVSLAVSWVVYLANDSLGLSNLLIVLICTYVPWAVLWGIYDITDRFAAPDHSTDLVERALEPQLPHNALAIAAWVYGVSGGCLLTFAHHQRLAGHGT